MPENTTAKNEKEKKEQREPTGLAKNLEKALKVAERVQKRLEETTRVDESRLSARITI